MKKEPFFISRKNSCSRLDRSIPPVLKVDPGSVVTFETDDTSYERLWRGEPIDSVGHGNFNILTGPLYVQDAMPGDALKIDILKIDMDRAWVCWFPEYGCMRTDTLQIKPVTFKENRAYISERLSVPFEPMIGCIGLVPAQGVGSTYVPAYPYGGNMDLKELSPGATLYLPVQVPGALLSVGDLHAGMGVAEPTCVGLEGRGNATLCIGLEKGLNIKFPRIRLGTSTFFVGIGDSLIQAQKYALDEAREFVSKTWNLDPFETFAYFTARVSVRFGGPATDIILAEVPDL